MKVSEDACGDNLPDRHPFDHWIVGLPIVHPLFLYAPTGAHAGFVLGESPIWGSITIEVPYIHEDISPI